MSLLVGYPEGNWQKAGGRGGEEGLAVQMTVARFYHRL